MMGCSTASKNNVVYLKNDHIKIGILPNVGGRMVFLSRIGGNNILKTDVDQWNESEEERIKPSPFSEFKAYNGLITWVGPQSQWWSDQDVNPELQDAKSIWPPDPYLIYGNFKIVNKTETSLTMIGLKSPVSGVQLTKHYTIKNNKLIIKVTGENIRNRAISFDVWSNARFDGFTDFIVPAYDEDLLKVDSKESESVERLAYKIENGFFNFIKELPSKSDKARIGKAFLHPQKGIIIAVRDNTFLLMEFDSVDKNKIHPDQGFIEVYNEISNEDEDGLLELEHHSAYKTLKPGESNTLTETWSLYEYSGPKDHRDYYSFYKEIQP